MEVVVGMHAGQNTGGCMSGDAEAVLVCEVKTLVTPDQTAVQVSSSGYGRAGIGWSSMEGLNMGRHEKTGSLSMQPVGCTPWSSTDDLLGMQLNFKQWSLCVPDQRQCCCCRHCVVG